MIDTLLRGARPADRAVHQPARRADDRADLGRRRAAQRRGVRARVQRRRAVHAPGRREPGAPAVVLRDDRGDGVRRVRRRARSTWPSSRSGWAARGTPPTSPTPPSRWCCRSRSTTRATSGTRPPRSPSEKAGIIKPGSDRGRRRAAARRRRGAAPPGRGGRRHDGPRGDGLRGRGPRAPAVGGQVVSLQGLRARYDELFLPLYGAHQAQNAAVALAAVEAFLGERAAGRRGRARRVRRGHLARPARDRPAQPDDRCSTPRTTRTARRRRPPPWTTRSRSRR